MPLTSAERQLLKGLINSEQQRQEAYGEAGFFWLIDSIETGTIRAEALRLATEKQTAKQLEIDSWPTVAQAHYADLQAELALITSLVGKLTP